MTLPSCIQLRPCPPPSEGCCWLCREEADSTPAKTWVGHEKGGALKEVASYTCHIHFDCIIGFFKASLINNYREDEALKCGTCQALIDFSSEDLALIQEVFKQAFHDRDPKSYPEFATRPYFPTLLEARAIAILIGYACKKNQTEKVIKEMRAVQGRLCYPLTPEEMNPANFFSSTFFQSLWFDLFITDINNEASHALFCFLPSKRFKEQPRTEEVTQEKVILRDLILHGKSRFLQKESERPQEDNASSLCASACLVTPLARSTMPQEDLRRHLHTMDGFLRKMTPERKKEFQLNSLQNSVVLQNRQLLSSLIALWQKDLSFLQEHFLSVFQLTRSTSEESPYNPLMKHKIDLLRSQTIPFIASHGPIFSNMITFLERDEKISLKKILASIPSDALLFIRKSEEEPIIQIVIGPSKSFHEKETALCKHIHPDEQPQNFDIGYATPLYILWQRKLEQLARKRDPALDQEMGQYLLSFLDFFDEDEQLRILGQISQPTKRTRPSLCSLQ